MTSSNSLTQMTVSGEALLLCAECAERLIGIEEFQVSDILAITVYDGQAVCEKHFIEAIRCKNLYNYVMNEMRKFDEK